jgi:hypothetical protein
MAVICAQLSVRNGASFNFEQRPAVGAQNREGPVRVMGGRCQPPLATTVARWEPAAGRSARRGRNARGRFGGRTCLRSNARRPKCQAATASGAEPSQFSFAIFLKNV